MHRAATTLFFGASAFTAVMLLGQTSPGAIESRLNAGGVGEGKVSLKGRVAPSPNAQFVAIESYDSLPAVFANVRSRAEQGGSQ
jgi:hypothetical protein